MGQDANRPPFSCKAIRIHGKILRHIPAAAILQNMNAAVHYPPTWRWTRRVAAHQEEFWRGRLEDGGYSPAVHGRPGARTVRLEIYAQRKTELTHLVKKFDGTLERINVEKIISQSLIPRRPIRITSGLAVTDVRGTWPTNLPRPAILLRIAGAMAFGTGEHATTASCLRFLQEEARHLQPGWTALDIGTGSGILAIAAEKLGAASVTAFDNDARAVSAALANARRNRCRRITITEGDVLRWSAGWTRHPVVAANVYSSILRAAAPRIIRAVRPGGCLILSGILRTEESEVLRTFLEYPLNLEKAARRGKWATFLLRTANQSAAKFPRKTSRSAE